jgi:hypothetical protein
MNYRPISSDAAEVDIFFDTSAFYVGRRIDISSAMWNRLSIGAPYHNPSSITDPHTHGRFILRNFGIRVGTPLATIEDSIDFFTLSTTRGLSGALYNFYGLAQQNPRAIGVGGDTSGTGLLVESVGDLIRI